MTPPEELDLADVLDRADLLDDDQADTGPVGPCGYVLAEVYRSSRRVRRILPAIYPDRDDAVDELVDLANRGRPVGLLVVLELHNLADTDT